MVPTMKANEQQISKNLIILSNLKLSLNFLKFLDKNHRIMQSLAVCLLLLENSFLNVTKFFSNERPFYSI